MAFLKEIFGERPKVPKMPVVTLPESQTAAIKANIGSQEETAKFGQFTLDEIEKMMEQITPGATAMREQGGENINAWLKGEIPTDVATAIGRKTGARNLNLGVAGSELGRNLTARDLGLTSLDLMSKGLSSAESWMAMSERIAAPAVENMNRMWITPQQQYSAQNEQNVQQFQRNWLSNQIGAMPNPQVAGAIDMTMKLLGRGGSGISMPSSAAVGGGGGGSDLAWLDSSSFGADMMGDVTANAMEGWLGGFTGT